MITTDKEYLDSIAIIDFHKKLIDKFKGLIRHLDTMEMIQMYSSGCMIAHTTKKQREYLLAKERVLGNITQIKSVDDSNYPIAIEACIEGMRLMEEKIKIWKRRIRILQN